MKQWVPEPEAVRKYYKGVSARAYERASSVGRGVGSDGAGSGHEVGSDRASGESRRGWWCGGI